jgi:hypothetical protein
MSEQYFWRNTVNVLGADIGKKGNPSHISVFAIVDEKISDTENKESLVQIHQRFLDGWPYIRQVNYFNRCVEWFGVQRGYVDNTRGELEERNLTREVVPITLGLRDGPVAKGKMKLATQFSLLVEQNRIRLLDDDRFLSQILCVSNELQAPNTPQGHGDAFISIMLAVGVYFDYYAPDRRKGTFNLGNFQDIIDMDSKPAVAKMMDGKDSDKCKICGGRNYVESSDGLNKICQKCFTTW